MERDFLGLRSRNPVVKLEVDDDCSDKEVPRSCGMQQSSKLVRSVPQFLCFDGAQEDKQMKLVYDPLMSSRLLAASTDSSSSSLKPFDTVLQPKRHLNHMVCSSTPQCQGNRTANALLPVLPSTSSLNPWKPASPSAKPSQLTIFYGGSVSVYDDVSPEKAQAIMLLAGNGGSASTSSIACSKPLFDTVTLNPSDTVVLPGQGVPLCSEVGGIRATRPRLVGTNGLPCGLGSALRPRISSSPLASSVPPGLSSALPQARKASLARFLEKRKERAISTMPYTFTKESLDSTVTTKDGGMDLMANSFDN